MAVTCDSTLEVYCCHCDSTWACNGFEQAETTSQDHWDENYHNTEWRLSSGGGDIPFSDAMRYTVVCEECSLSETFDAELAAKRYAMRHNDKSDHTVENIKEEPAEFETIEEFIKWIDNNDLDEDGISSAQFVMALQDRFGLSAHEATEKFRSLYNNEGLIYWGTIEEFRVT